jgi:Mg/Co/Ni transporter MgtE
MIVVDTNLSFVFSRLGISASKYAEKYTNKTIDEMIEAEAQEGNPLALELASEMMNNITLVMELFKLADPKNRLEILSQMTSAQMYKFMPLMEQKDLAQGMYFFTTEKMMEMLEQLPPEQLLKTALEMFSKQELIKLMPDQQLDRFLQNEEIGKEKILKYLKDFQPQYLAQMLESITGEFEDSMDSYDLTVKLGELKPLDFKNALVNMPPEQKQRLVLELSKENEEWMQAFEAKAVTHIIETQRDKVDVVKALGGGSIDQEEMIKMIKELPNDLLAVIITQLDPQIFAETLMKELPEVMAEIMLM